MASSVSRCGALGLSAQGISQTRAASPERRILQ
jgi:hypothetical protein